MTLQAQGPSLGHRQPNEEALSILAIAWRWKVVVGLGFCLGVALGWAYYKLRPPVYQSRAEIAIVPKHADSTTTGTVSELSREDYVAAQEARLRSPLIVDSAIQQEKLDDLPSLAHPTDSLTSVILRNLKVTRGRTQFGENNLITLTFRGQNPDDCGKVVSAIVAAHQRYMTSAHEAAAKANVDALLQARDSAQRQLAQTENAYASFRKDHPLISKGNDGLTLFRQQLANIQSRRSALLLRRTELEARLATLQAAQKAGKATDAWLALLAEPATNDAADSVRRNHSTATQDQLAALLLEEQKLLASLGPNHPDVQGVKQRIDAARALLAKPAANWPSAMGPVRSDRALADHMVFVRQRISEVDQVDRILAGHEQTAAKELSAVETDDERHRADLNRMRQLYDDLLKRVQEAKLNKDAGGYDVQIINPPSKAEKVAPSLLLTLPASVFLGLLCGLAAAYGLARRDDRFRSTAEVQQALAYPVLGALPRFHGTRPLLSGGGAMDPLICSYWQPTSSATEAFRMVRTALYYAGADQGRHTIQITSPGHAAGKSILASNLAVAIAQTGKQVILVDANLRSPRLRQLFGMSAQAGLADVLAGTADAADALIPTAVGNLSLLTAGSLHPNPADLLTSRSFSDLLHWLRERGDYVIIDSPALLDAADSAIIAAHVDGVLLTIQVGTDTRELAEVSRERLTAVGANVLGVIVNGVTSRLDIGPQGYDAGAPRPSLPRPESEAVPAVIRAATVSIAAKSTR